MFNFLTNKISEIFSGLNGQSKLSEQNIVDALSKVRDALLEADVPYEVVEKFVAQIKEESLGLKVTGSTSPSEQFAKIFYDRLKEFMGNQASFTSFQIPSVIMVMGLQGSGKTTTIAKLAAYSKKQAEQKNKTRKILLGSVDFYRPAAVDQLEVLAGQIGVDFYRSDKTNPVAAASDIYDQYKSGSYDYLFLDTAGRLHVDSDMLQELVDINLNLNPKHKLLVLDSMTGQESLKVAQAFDRAVGFNGSVLTKMDSDTLGGAAFAFRYVLQKPVYFIGTGEKSEDLELFHPDRMATKILGMGDLQTLVERAQEKVKKSDQDQAANAFKRGKLTLDDFAKQLEMVNKMGSLSKVMQYMPGLSGANVSQDMLDKGEQEMKMFKAIISSMTHKERVYPKILDSSRRQRIAKGAGVTTSDIGSLLKRFEQSAQFVKLFKKSGKLQNMFKF